MSSLVLISPAKQPLAAPWLEALDGLPGGLMPISPPVPEAIPALIRQHAGAVNRVIIGGGDGTLRGAAGALVESGLPLGILPLGTANDLAHSLYIPINPAGAATVIRAGRTQRIDLGLVNGHHFFNAAQIGLGAMVRSGLSLPMKRLLGPASYAVGAWDAVRRIRSFTATVGIMAGDMASETMVFRSVHITIGNGTRYGGGTPVAPGASLSDGELDLFSVDPLPRWRLALVAAALRRGHHKRLRHVHMVRAAALRIETSHRLSVTADGENISHTPADFSVLPAGVTIYTGETPSGRDR